MKFIYIVTDLNGKELMRGSAFDCAEKLGVTDRDVYAIQKGTEIGINVYKVEVSQMKQTIKEQTMTDYIRMMLKMYNNTVLGKETRADVKKALKQLAKEGIRIIANETKDGWYLERV